MTDKQTASDRLRVALAALAAGKPARLDPADLCAVLHENEHLRGLADPDLDNISRAIHEIVC